MNRFLMLIVLAIPFVLEAQTELSWDSSRTHLRKNVVKWNLTPFSLFGTQNIVLGYERVIGDHQSISLNAGHLKFRPILNLDLSEYNISGSRSGGGFSIALDYRRYVKKRNRGFAPDGLYWGPYLVYYTYGTKLNLNYVQTSTNTVSNAELSADFTIMQAGLQLGYQFIIARRFSIDLILLGPGAGIFSANAKLDGSLSLDEENEVFQALYDKAVSRVPGLENLIEDHSFSNSGSIRSGSAGLRYVIQIGVLF